MDNLPPSIDHLNGRKYQESTEQKYKSIVLFLKENQHQIKLATDKEEFNEILSGILEAKNAQMQKRLATDGASLRGFPELRSIFKSNPLANEVRKYLVTFYRSSSSKKEDYYLELKTFYEENKKLFDSLCNFIFTFSN